MNSIPFAIHYLEWDSKLSKDASLYDLLMGAGVYFWRHKTPDPRWLISFQCDLWANSKISTCVGVNSINNRIVSIAGFAPRGDLNTGELEPFWLVHHAYRSIGLGTATYKAAESLLPTRFHTLVAQIELTNTPSLKFAAKQGYNHLIRDGDYSLVSKRLSS
jgi:RimJ/RimL family protein N-acetyltransferase